MLIHVAHYVIVAHMSLVVGDGVANVNVSSDNETVDSEIYSKAACTVICLKHRNYSETSTRLHECYDDCAWEVPIGTPMQSIQENWLLRLICRDEHSLTFRFDRLVSQVASTAAAANETGVIYFIKVKSASEAEHHIYLSNSDVFTLTNLSQHTQHNITAVAVRGDRRFAIVAKNQPYTTLRRGYRPGMVASIQADEFAMGIGNVGALSARISWRPPSQLVCHYDIVCYATNADYIFEKTKFDIRALGHHDEYRLEHLELASEYKVGIRPRSSNDRSKETKLLWHAFRTPACLNSRRDNADHMLCVPTRPRALLVAQTSLSGHDYSLNVSWEQPEHQPDYYLLRIFVLRENATMEVYNISGDAKQRFIARITLDVSLFHVHLTAYTSVGNNTAVIELTTIAARWNAAKILTVIYACAAGLLLLLLAGCLLCRRHASLKRYKQRCKYFEELERNAPINVEATMTLQQLHLVSDLAQLQSEFDAKLSSSDDGLEVAREHITLYEVLGEGAFGLVRRGIYMDKKLGAIEVAVKMLKDLPSIEDMHAFRREIDVMKAVKQHPNIVGIIGHCMRQCNRMLLLTEYCSLGNLLELLRDECRFLHEMNSNSNNSNANAKLCKAAAAVTTTSFIEHFRQKYLNVSRQPTARSFPTPGANVFIEDFDAGEKDDGEQRPAQRIISVENQTYFQQLRLAAPVNRRRPLCAANLLDMAKQAAVGMEFLAKNRVVHRDLAARNVLVSHNRTIKIADFGLSRDVYQENIYKKTGGQGKLPIKWLALESMTHQLYTTKSDVWSYGILLFEIVTLGGTPYPSIGTNRLLPLLKSGYRMERPKYCGAQLYELMCSCWFANPIKRPTFTQIVQILDKFSSDPSETQLETVWNLLQRRHNEIDAADTMGNDYLKPL